LKTNNINSAERFLSMNMTFQQKDETIFQVGSVEYEVQVIVSAKIRIIAHNNSEKEKLIRVLEPGDFLGEMALVDSSPRSTTTISNEDVKIDTPSSKINIRNDRCQHLTVYCICRMNGPYGRIRKKANPFRSLQSLPVFAR